MSGRRVGPSVILTFVAAIILLAFGLTFLSVATHDDRARAVNNVAYVRALNQRLGAPIAVTPDNLPRCPVSESLNNCLVVAVPRAVIAQTNRRRIVDDTGGAKVCVFVVGDGTEIADRYAVQSGREIDHYWCERAFAEARIAQ